MEVNISKKDKFNGMNSAGAVADVLDQDLTIKGMFDYEDDVVNTETGEVERKTLIVLITDKGVYSSPSNTLVESCLKLYEIFADDVVDMVVRIKGHKSNNNRTFYRLECVD